MSFLIRKTLLRTLSEVCESHIRRRRKAHLFRGQFEGGVSLVRFPRVRQCKEAFVPKREGLLTDERQGPFIAF